MRPVRHLEKLRKVASRRCVYLKSLVAYLRPPIGSREDRLVAYTCIEALNLWGSFSRSFYISVALGVIDCSGIRVRASSRQRAPSDAINIAVTRMRSGRRGSGPWTQRDEPTWHDPRTLIVLFTHLSTSNLNTVQSALSYQTNVFRMLPTFRNFFAHRNEETAGKIKNRARNLGVSPTLRPCEILCTSQPGRSQHVLSDWLDDLRVVINLMCN